MELSRLLRLSLLLLLLAGLVGCGANSYRHLSVPDPLQLSRRVIKLAPAAVDSTQQFSTSEPYSGRENAASATLIRVTNFGKFRRLHDYRQAVSIKEIAVRASPLEPLPADIHVTGFTLTVSITDRENIRVIPPLTFSFAPPDGSAIRLRSINPGSSRYRPIGDSDYLFDITAGANTLRQLLDMLADSQVRIVVGAEMSVADPLSGAQLLTITLGGGWAQIVF